MPKTRPFAVLAGDPEATLDVLALALAAGFGVVDAAGAMARLASSARSSRVPLR